MSCIITNKEFLNGKEFKILHMLSSEKKFEWARTIDKCLKKCGLAYIIETNLRKHMDSHFDMTNLELKSYFLCIKVY